MSINQSAISQFTFWAPVQEVTGWVYGGKWLTSTQGWVVGNTHNVVGYNARHDQYRLLSRTYIYGDLSPWTVGEVINLA